MKTRWADGGFIASNLPGVGNGPLLVLTWFPPRWPWESHNQTEPS